MGKFSKPRGHCKRTDFRYGNVENYLLVNGQKIKAGYADKAGYVEGMEDMFLRKDQSDGTNFLLKFGEFIDSMVAGKGAGIFPDGRMQLSRLEVRDSLTVLELIFNRLSAMESDYSFSESGTIESVSQLEDGTYSLKMKKRWDNDFTALAENDVVLAEMSTCKTRSQEV